MCDGFEQEPNFLGVSHLGVFNSNVPVLDEYYNEFVSNLQSQNSDIVL